MRSIIPLFLCVFSTLAVAGILPEGDPDIGARGDANLDWSLDNSDPIYLSNYLHYGGPEPPCMNNADANHDGRVDNSDIVYLLEWMNNGGPAPPAPGPSATECSTAPEPYLSCDAGCD